MPGAFDGVGCRLLPPAPMSPLWLAWGNRDHIKLTTALSERPLAFPRMRRAISQACAAGNGITLTECCRLMGSLSGHIGNTEALPSFDESHRASHSGATSRRRIFHVSYHYFLAARVRRPQRLVSIIPAALQQNRRLSSRRRDFPRRPSGRSFSRKVVTVAMRITGRDLKPISISACGDNRCQKSCRAVPG